MQYYRQKRLFLPFVWSSNQWDIIILRLLEKNHQFLAVLFLACCPACISWPHAVVQLKKNRGIKISMMKESWALENTHYYVHNMMLYSVVDIKSLNAAMFTIYTYAYWNSNCFRFKSVHAFRLKECMGEILGVGCILYTLMVWEMKHLNSVNFLWIVWNFISLGFQQEVSQLRSLSQFCDVGVS